MVFVLDANKQPLHPCHQARARKLLRDGKAAVYMAEPFTIILKRVVEEAPEKEYRVKIDYGSRHTGVAILRDDNVCWLGQFEHRTDIKKKLQQRSGYRRRRRTANLRYRKPRFLNRTKPKVWLPPSLMSRVDNIKTLIQRLMKLVPIGAISYENVKFDTQLMQNPDTSGVKYQQGTLFGYEVREYLMTAEEFGFPNIRKKALVNLQDAALVTATRWKVLEVLNSFGLPVECGTGARTKMNRIRLGLPKEHYYDACCVGASTPQKLYFKTNEVQIIRAVGRGSHQRTNVNASGFPSRHRKRK